MTRAVERRLFLVGLTIGSYLVIKAAQWWLVQQYGSPVIGPIYEVLSRAAGGALVVGAALYGNYREQHFPARAEYRRWLETTPWTSSKPLPLGPAHFQASDFAYFSVLAVLAHLEGVHWLWVFTAAMVAYLLSLCVDLLRSHSTRDAIALLWVLPLLSYAESKWLLASLLVLSYGVGYLTLRRALASVSWTPDQPPVPQELGWPFEALALRSELSKPPWGRGVLVGLLLAWWFYSIGRFAPAPDLWNAHWILIAIALFVATVRWVYYVGGHMPSTSIVTRIAIGRLIIPAYDRVFLAPLAILVTAWLGPWAGQAMGLPPLASLALSVAAIIAIAVDAGPDRRDWQLTAPCRLLMAIHPARRIKAA